MPETAHKRLLSRIALLVIFSTTSIQIGLLKIGIWANMFDEFYEETHSVALSAEWTFDGSRRCAGCQLVEDLGSAKNEALGHLNSFSVESPLLLDLANNIVVPKTRLMGKGTNSEKFFVSKIDSVDIPPPKV